MGTNRTAMQTVEACVSYRIPLVGGTTDYPDYYREFGAQSICCPIDKYLYVSIQKNGQGGLNIQSKADLPWGTGLGSSGAFHSAMVLAFAKDRKQKLSPLVVGKLAYELETGIDPYATGRQDSLACLFKGVSEFKYHRDDSVSVHRIAIPPPGAKSSPIAYCCLTAASAGGRGIPSRTCWAGKTSRCFTKSQNCRAF